MPRPCVTAGPGDRKGGEMGTLMETGATAGAGGNPAAVAQGPTQRSQQLRVSGGV
jgi:hypothetical protein